MKPSKLKAGSLDPKQAVTIGAIDLTALTCKRGGVIRVTPRNGIRLRSVAIEILDLLGGEFESGSAQWDEASGRWCYVTGTDLPHEIRIIQITAVGPHNICTLSATQVPSHLTPPAIPGLSDWRSN